MKDREPNIPQPEPDSEPSEGITNKPLLPIIWARKDRLFFASSIGMTIWGCGNTLAARIGGPSFELYDSLSGTGPNMIKVGLAGITAYFGGKFLLNRLADLAEFQKKLTNHNHL